MPVPAVEVERGFCREEFRLFSSSEFFAGLKNLKPYRVKTPHRRYITTATRDNIAFSVSKKVPNALSIVPGRKQIIGIVKNQYARNLLPVSLCRNLSKLIIL